MFPEIPTDLSALSDDELAELYAQLQAYFNEHRDEALTNDEVLANCTAAADATDAIRAEQDTRAEAAAERQTELNQLAARMEPAAETPPGEGEGDGEQPPAGDGDAPPEGDQPAEGETPPAEGTQPQGVAAAGTRPGRRQAASGRRTPPLSQLGQGTTPAAPPAPAQPIRPPVTIVAGGDIPHTPVGSQLEGIPQLAQALVGRRESMRGGPAGGEGESVIVASVLANYPDDRMLKAGFESENRRKLSAVTSPEAITAAGGVCGPLQPYYEVMVLAGASRPMADSLARFGMDRQGVTLIPPPQLTDVGAQARTVADGATTNASNVVTSVAANFNSADVGATITGAGIPASTIIVAVNPAANQATLSANATATASGVSLTVTRPGPIGFFTMAQDAAALNGTPTQVAVATKPCLHVACPAPVTFTTNAITRCFEFGNFAPRANPELVEAWLALGMAQWARRAETAVLDQISANSTQVTAAKVLGVARDIVPQVVKAAAYYRNRNRMDPQAPLRWAGPAWLIDAAVADLVRGSAFETEFYSMARQLFVDGLREANINTTFYIDSGTGKGQLMNAGAKQGAGALTTFPATCVWYLFAEGSFVLGDGGSIDIGLFRDSGLVALNNYRVFFESFEVVIPLGVESLEVTSTIVADGTAAGLAYGLGASTALPASF